MNDRRISRERGRNLSRQSEEYFSRRSRSRSVCQQHGDVSTSQTRQQTVQKRNHSIWQNGSIKTEDRRMYILANDKLFAFEFSQVRGRRVHDGDRVRFKLDNNGDVVVVCLETPEEVGSRVEDVHEKSVVGRAKIRQRQVAPKPKLEPNRSYSSLCPSSAYQQGVIVHINKKNNTGFMKAISKSPSALTKTCDILLRISDVRSAGLELIPGDVIQFSLSAQDKSRPMAFQTSVVRFKQRQEAELVDYIRLISLLLTNDEADLNDEDDESGVLLGLPERYRKMRKRTFLVELIDNKAVWSCLGNQRFASLDTIKSLLELTLLVESLSKGMDEAFSGILNCLMESKMFNARNGCFKSILKDVCRLQTEHVMALFRRFFCLLFKYVPEQLPSTVSLMQPMMSSGNITNSLEQTLYYGLKQMTKLFGYKTTALDWEDVPLVPAQDELLSSTCVDDLFLSPVKTSYESTDEYLETYFRLLRADCFDALKRGIRALLEGRLDSRDMNVYVNVSVAAIHVDDSAGELVVGLRVTPQKAVKDWNNCSKLMFGNLLVISPSGNFRDGILATVSTRDTEILNKHQMIFVELCGASVGTDDVAALMTLIHSSEQMTMVESPTYFKAYQPVLNALQKKKTEHLPFYDQLIKGRSPDHVLPEYVDEAELNGVEPSIFGSLDTYQKQALQFALRNQVACIQGPPGTGKTYVGIKIVQLLLKMKCKPSSPILVITYKNHALDEFLKEIIKTIPDGVARVGGRSSEPILESYTLTNLARNRTKDQLLYETLRELRMEMDEMKSRVQSSATKLSLARCINVDSLIDYLDEDQLASLLSGSNKDLKRMTVVLISEALKQNEASEEAYRELKNAYTKWCPQQAFIKRIEDDYYKSVTVDISCPDEESQQNEDVDDDLLDEKDVDNIEQQRLVEGDRKRISLKEVIEFGAKHGLSPIVKLVSADPSYTNRLPFLKLMNVKNLWSLNARERFLLLQCLLVKQLSDLVEEFENVLHEYKMLSRQKREFENQRKVEILSSMNIIGMTVNGASINQELLMQVKPAIIIVEEAAELLESHVLAALDSSVQHLIMIGDHQQLRPQVESYILQKNYKFDLSMMERLIMCQLPFVTLKQQNRMLPEIAELLHDIYPELESNLAVVSKRKKSASMEKSMFFWTHTDKETKARSYTNELEARRAVNLAVFLVEQGHAPSSITILSTYQGQVALLRRLMREAVKRWSNIFEQSRLDTSAKKNTEITIHTVDVYQGDENDIVIVSLVRSNDERKIGFLKMLNRRCVAQSRGRCGIYFIGNAKTLKAEDHWERFIMAMEKRDCFGESIRLLCKKHPNTTISARTADDIPVAQCFCSERCLEIFPCRKHICMRACQPVHSHKMCSVPCPEKMPCLHDCSRTCHPPHEHEYCSKIIEYTCTKCGNVGKKECSEKEDNVLCNAEVSFEFPCTHMGIKKCYEDERTKKCTKPCQKRLRCSHPCNRKCSEQCNHDSCETCKAIKELEEKRKLEAEKKRKEDEIKKALDEANEEIEKIKTLTETKLELITEDGDSLAEYEKINRFVTTAMPKPVDRAVEVKHIKRIVCPAVKKACLENMKKLNDPRHSDLKFLKSHTRDVEELEKSISHVKLTTGPNGKGVYVSSNLVEIDVTYEGNFHKALIVDALLGKMENIQQSSSTSFRHLNVKEYDSLYTRNVTVGSHHTGDQFVLRSAKQVIPRYVVTYSISESLDDPAVNYIEREALRGSSTEISNFSLSPSREQRQDDSLDHVLRQAESQFYRLLHEASEDLKYTRKFDNIVFKGVDYYVNPKLLKAFHRMRQTLAEKHGPKYSNYILAFHGTNPDNVKTIMENNFDHSKLSTGSGDKGWYGAGIYLSEYPQTSLLYGQSLILCRVLPGKSFDMKPENIRLGGDLKEGFDSHRVNVQEKGYGEELVVFQPDQILPYCVVNYELQESKRKKKKKGGNKMNK